MARILHGRDVSRSHGLQQARPRLWGQPRSLAGWLVPLEHLCQAFGPIAFPEAASAGSRSSRPSARSTRKLFTVALLSSRSTRTRSAAFCPRQLCSRLVSSSSLSWFACFLSFYFNISLLS